MSICVRCCVVLPYCWVSLTHVIDGVCSKIILMFVSETGCED
jgi:hypothetical protein